jgi:outer membrane protein W
MAARSFFCFRLRRSKLIAGAAIAGAAAFATTAARAQDGYDFRLFVGGAFVEPLNDSNIGSVNFETSSEVGIELAGEWRFSRLGFEVAYLDAEQDLEANGNPIGDIDLKPWNFTLNFHVIDGDFFNWFIGPTLSYVDWGDLKLQSGNSVETDSETTWGVSTGILFGLGDTFGIELGLRYIDSAVESQNIPQDVAVDPLFARVGVSFRF